MTRRTQRDNERRMTLGRCSLWLILLTCFSGSPVQADSLDEKQLVEKAQHTLESFMNDPNLTWFQQHVNDAKALLIMPQQLRAAFFVGADGGNGVLVARDERNGQWSEPVFYTVGGLSLGLQVGGDASEVILLAMTQGAVDSLYTSSFKLGGDASIAAGPYGGGVEGATSSNFDADFLSFSRSSGAYAGVSFEGSVIYTDDDANEAYYGKKVRPADVLISHSVTNGHSSELRQAVERATGK